MVKSESVSVNEAEYCCWNFLKVARTLSECCCVEDVTPPIQEMRLAVVLQCGLVECVCSVAISVLCAKLRVQATPD